MNENTGNNDWKMEAPSLAARAKTNPFTVPEEYFSQTGESVFSAVFLDGLKQKTNENNFEVPQNYFENLTERIEINIRLIERPRAESTFAVPANYFDTLQNRINSKIEAETNKSTAKIIPLWKKSIFKYASAACFIIMASFGAYFYKNTVSIPVAQSLPADLDRQQILYDIDESTIIEHIEAQNTSVRKTTSASDTEMENYILRNFSSNDLTQELYN